MGTINYKTSDYITVGVKPYDFYDFTIDRGFMNYARETAEREGITVDDIILDHIRDYYEDDRGNIETELKKHDFYYYHVKIVPGYYEGFTIDIESNFGIAYDSWEDRREAQKEITEIKQFLIECAGLGLVVCWPGWCTGYGDYKQTLAAINEAVKDMRAEARQTPTWRQYMRDCGEAV